MNWLDINVLTFQYFLLVMSRLGSMIAFAPLLGSGSVPPQVKLGLSFFLSIIMFPIVSRDFPPLPGELVMFWILMIREALVGIMIGVIGNLMFTAMQVSGRIFGIQVGFGIVNVVDPMSEQQVSILGQFEFIIAVLLFFTINGHHVLIRIIAESYLILPLGAFTITEPLGLEVTGWLQKMFIIAYKIGMPMIFTLLLVTVALGVLARTVPQMNVFIVGLPLKIFVGLFMMLVSLTYVVYLLREYFDMMFRDIVMLMKMAAGGG